MSDKIIDHVGGVTFCQLRPARFPISPARAQNRLLLLLGSAIMLVGRRQRQAHRFLIITKNNRLGDEFSAGDGAEALIVEIIGDAVLSYLRQRNEGMGQFRFADPAKNQMEAIAANVRRGERRLNLAQISNSEALMSEL